jgi:hypothetical protein
MKKLEVKRVPTRREVWKSAGQEGFIRSEQFAEFVRGQPGIFCNRSHGEGIDRIVTW